jgi:uncharacterized repeat protein (TIGR03803 family)
MLNLSSFGRSVSVILKASKAVRLWCTVAIALAGLVTTTTANAQTYSVLYSFTGAADGFFPQAGLTADPAGNLYGTTQWGGMIGGACGLEGCGVVFKLDQTGHETVLHTFMNSDGSDPAGVLLRDSAGHLYGTTSGGGPQVGYGLVFRLNASGTETVLYSFASSKQEGTAPSSGLALDSAGNFYSTTVFGGDFQSGDPLCGPSGCGVVFKLSPAGTETVLHAFTGQDGAFAYAGVARDEAGNLYGATTDGGSAGTPFGVIFKLDPQGKETVLHNFTGGTDGNDAVATPILDSAGNLYGTTAAGGNLTTELCGDVGCGVVYKIDPVGTESVLYSFTGDDGAGPRAGLVRDSAGNLYGTAVAGGIFNSSCQAGGCGVVFKLDPEGNETVLYSFTGGTDGASPDAALLGPINGYLYGVAQYGGLRTSECGRLGCGVVFKIKL